MAWLDLFEQTAAELFAAELAEAFAIKARRIAGSLRLALFSPPAAIPLEDWCMRKLLAGRAALR